MTVYFFDSSALIKRYITETGTPWVRTITTSNGADSVFIAQITLVEIFSALARRKRERSISPRTAQAAGLLVNRHAHREYIVVPFSDSVIKRAQDLTDAHPLRASDAIQLASTLDINERLVAAHQPALIMVCADLRLLTVAAHEGLGTHNPT